MDRSIDLGRLELEQLQKRHQRTLMKQKQLQDLGKQCAKKGGVKQASKYFADSYEVVMDLPMSPEQKVLQAATCGDLYKELLQFGPALQYYCDAMKSVKEVKPISLRSVLGVRTQSDIAVCLTLTNRAETAGQVFKDAIENYEACQGHYALMNPPQKEAIFLDVFDVEFAEMMMSYALVLMMLNRRNEISAMRQQIARAVRRSTALRSQETMFMDLFDNAMKRSSLLNDRLIALAAKNAARSMTSRRLL